MRLSFLVFSLFLYISLSGCAATRTSVYSTSKNTTICNKHSTPDLGNIIVLPEVAWRPDQKEPEKRNAMFMGELQKVFTRIPCGTIIPKETLQNISSWSSIPDSTLRSTFSAKGADTIILIRIEELTPRLEFTFSIPFLWSGKSEADFRIKVISVKSGKTLNDMRVKRVTGGPFNIRPAEWSKTELYEALRSII